MVSNTCDRSECLAFFGTGRKAERRVPRPEPSPLADDEMARLVDAHLDFLIDSQKEDGGWEPRWDWGGAYPEAWEQARREWKGIVTLETLTSLAAYGRIAT